MDLLTHFVTIGTRDREETLGIVEGDRTILSDWGEIAEECWLEIPRHFPYAVLDEHVIMPNHMHGIIILKGKRGKDFGEEGFGKPVRGSLSTILRSYKSAVTRTINRARHGHGFVWQGGFHEHRIRDEEELERIRRYIRENPRKWSQERKEG